jgi:hypothetical protein
MLIEYVYESNPEIERAVMAISSFFIWLKFLYFMRMNRSTSKFISIIVAVIRDMKVFMLVFAIVIFSFSQSLYILSNNNDNADKRFIDSMDASILFTYCIGLGSWEADNLGEKDVILVYTFFILATLFLCIIMLNLLIAVVSDTYAAVDSSSSNELYKNLADLIIENQFLVPKSDIEEHDN